MYTPGANSMHICGCVAVCVCVREPPTREAASHKASLALTRGPSARAGGMKLKVATQEKKTEKFR